MPDLSGAASTAFFRQLKAWPATTGQASVLEFVPEKRQPPFVVVGRVTSVPIGPKDSPLDQLTVEVITLVRKPGKEFLTPVLRANREALHNRKLPLQPGVQLSKPIFESEDIELAEDGQTYLGTQRFSLFAQPA